MKLTEKIAQEKMRAENKERIEKIKDIKSQKDLKTTAGFMAFFGADFFMLSVIDGIMFGISNASLLWRK